MSSNTERQCKEPESPKRKKLRKVGSKKVCLGKIAGRLHKVSFVKRGPSKGKSFVDVSGRVQSLFYLPLVIILQGVFEPLFPDFFCP